MIYQEHQSSDAEAPDMSRRTYLGTSGFSFPDWHGTVYPKGTKASERFDYYLAAGFNAVEINSTFYAIPEPRVLEKMARKAPRNFKFAVKAFKGITHKPFETAPGQPRTGFEEALKSAQRMREILEPLACAGKVFAVIAQFPFQFRPGRESRAYIESLQEKFKGLDMAVEFRCAAWASNETERWLAGKGLTLCVVDAPRHPKLMPFWPRTTSQKTYFRFHGRNPHWFGASLAERYDYEYSDQELKELARHVIEAGKQAKGVGVFFNNCHRGQAFLNAAKMGQYLGFSLKAKPDLSTQLNLF